MRGGHLENPAYFDSSLLVGSGYPTTDFGYDKNKKRKFIHRLYLINSIATSFLADRMVEKGYLPTPF